MIKLTICIQIGEIQMNKNGNLILTSLMEADTHVKEVSSIPEGYIEVKLSTKGKVGAPPVVHVRNFKVSEIISLSLSGNSDLPIRLISILNDMILEDTDVFNWHEKEIEELMVYIFLSFYKPILTDVPFPFNDEDFKKMEAEANGETRVRDIKEGRWVPKTTIDIASGVDTYDLDDTFNPEITITNRKTGFYVIFDYIKYGDQLVIKQWMDSYFAEDEKRFERIKKQIEINRGISNQLKDNPDKVDNLITIDKEEERAFKDYLIRRAQVITDISNIVSIVNFNGQDLSRMSIGEKYELLKDDARLDYNLISKMNARQMKMKFGIKPEVKMKNPITGEVVKRPLSFRIPSILQTMQVCGSDEYDDGYDD